MRTLRLQQQRAAEARKREQAIPQPCELVASTPQSNPEYPKRLRILDQAGREKVAYQFRTATGIPWDQVEVNEFGLLVAAMIRGQGKHPALPHPDYSDSKLHDFWAGFLLKHLGHFTDSPNALDMSACGKDSTFLLKASDGETTIRWRRGGPGDPAWSQVRINRPNWPFQGESLLNDEQLRGKVALPIYGTIRTSIVRAACDALHDGTGCESLQSNVDSAKKAATLIEGKRVKVQLYWTRELIDTSKDPAFVELRSIARARAALPESFSYPANVHVALVLNPTDEKKIRSWVFDTKTGEQLGSLTCRSAGRVKKCNL